jgi:hypothetical protein
MKKFIPYFPFDEYFLEEDDDEDFGTGFRQYVNRRWAEEADA